MAGWALKEQIHFPKISQNTGSEFQFPVQPKCICETTKTRWQWRLIPKAAASHLFQTPEQTLPIVNASDEKIIQIKNNGMRLREKIGDFRSKTRRRSRREQPRTSTWELFPNRWLDKEKKVGNGLKWWWPPEMKSISTTKSFYLYKQNIININNHSSLAEKIKNKTMVTILCRVGHITCLAGVKE